MGSLALRPGDSLTTPKDGFVSQLHPLRFLHECDSSYGALTSTPVGLSPTKQTSLSWTHSLANYKLLPEYQHLTSLAPEVCIPCSAPP